MDVNPKKNERYSASCDGYHPFYRGIPPPTNTLLLLKFIIWFKTHKKYLKFSWTLTLLTALPLTLLTRYFQFCGWRNIPFVSTNQNRCNIPKLNVCRINHPDVKLYKFHLLAQGDLKKLANLNKKIDTNKSKETDLQKSNFLYTYGTKKLWDFKVAADIHEWSKIKIYVDIYVISDILKTSAQNGKAVVTHITHMMYGRQEGSFTVSHI